MNALEKLVPKDLEQHLMLNFARFKNFEEMEKEVVNYMEAKTGNKMVLSTNFSKASGGSSSGAVPMDVDSLAQLVSGNIASLAKTKGDGGKIGKGKGKSGKFDGNCDLCGKYGHRRRDCWMKPGKGSGKPKGGKGDQGEKFAGKCNHCGKVGHKKADCWSLKGKAKGDGKGGKSSGKTANSVEATPRRPCRSNGERAGSMHYHDSYT